MTNVYSDLQFISFCNESNINFYEFHESNGGTKEQIPVIRKKKAMTLNKGYDHE